MATILKLGPRDHGKKFSDDEFKHADYAEGFHYEVIYGSLYVSQFCGVSHAIFHSDIYSILMDYELAFPEKLGYVSGKARVFVHSQSETTALAPDFSLYRERINYRDGHTWRDLSPFIVAEIVERGTRKKDLVRNVELYLQVPSILEYWVFDLEPKADAGMIVFRRVNDAWQKLPITAKEYLPELLPGLSVPTRMEYLE